jgi:glycosyltransferase involved in cell wall biosynthesis
MKYITPEISIVLPCLNEEKGVPFCARALKETLRRHDLDAEILFVNNRSEDGTLAILGGLREADERIVIETEDKRGYGHALKRGFARARGTLVYMADCDGTYDFDDIPRFILKMREGHDLVVGNRFSGGMDGDAMSFWRRWVGNPILSLITRKAFDVGIHDIHCGARMIRKDAYDGLLLKAGGMEFATEMIIRASKQGLKIAEIPIRYHRRIGTSKLNEVSDGMRHILLMLIESVTRTR